MSSHVLLAFTTLPDRASAERLAAAMIEARVAACVSLLEPCTSIYRWQGKIEQSNEVPLMIKTTQAAYPQLESLLRAQHPYELPELIAVPVNIGLPAYLQWVDHEVSLNTL